MQKRETSQSLGTVIIPEALCAMGITKSLRLGILFSFILLGNGISAQAQFFRIFYDFMEIAAPVIVKLPDIIAPVAVKNAAADPIAILIEIKFEKFVEK